MVRINTKASSINKENLIIDNESFFNINISSKIFTESELDIIKKLDSAELLDRNTGEIKTPYGLTSIRNLSTGCKTIINFMYINSNNCKYTNIKAIDVTECGWNALELLFDYYEKINSNIILLLRHSNCLFNCSEREYLINNDKIITDLSYLEL